MWFKQAQGLALLRLKTPPRCERSLFAMALSVVGRPTIARLIQKHQVES
jgi:hypothetical protein